jgi:putative transposase
VPVETDEQALHLTRYIHLNPSSAGLVTGPGLWKYSSYGEYVGSLLDMPICDFKKIVRLEGNPYLKFVEDETGYQRSLQLIKAQLLD